MGKGYIESVVDIKLFAELMGVTVGEFEKIVQAGINSENTINAEFSQLEAGLSATKTQVNSLCQREMAKREACARKAITHMKEELKNIKDPHFHKMEQKYIRKCGRGSYRNAADTPRGVMDKLNSAVREFDKKVEELNHAFIPPMASGVIGTAVRPFRKNTYMEIIKLRDSILAYSEILMSYTDLQSQRNECGEAYEQRMDTEIRNRDEKLERVPVETKEKIDRLMSMFSVGMEQLHQDTCIFESDEKKIDLGRGIFSQANAGILGNSVLAEEECIGISESQITFPVRLDEIKENLLLTYEGDENIADIFCAMAIEILFASNDAEIYFSDIKGLGSTYRQLQSLTEFQAVNIWNTESQVEEGLASIEKWIADTYEKCLGNRFTSVDEFNSVTITKRKKKYVFINDLTENVPSKCFEQLLRIINNGNNAGVYVISAYALANFGNNRMLLEFLSDLNRSVVSIKLSNHLINLGNNTYMYFRDAVSESKISSLSCKLNADVEKSAILPIGPSLPKESSWQKMNAATEIVIPFGIDENGHQARFVLSSERPYGLIIGDVRVGKSSLLHTIIFQILSNYSPDEVRIAIGDFKDGADFNVYAKGNLKSIDAVVNDEDPDAMLSFLKYYVQEMQSRQKCFEQLEDATGIIIQKYENYRETNRSNGNIMPPMPRIVILIDEFQSLFDGSTCATYMTELVRKGATYGIHVVLSSQRAVSDNPRNGFSSSLKDYFTSRFVFKTPQNAARSMLAERCADTGRENSGIQKAALLKKGHAVYNSYMGQNEADNSVVQCYYASPEVIASFIQIMSALNGEGNSILLKRNAKSMEYPTKRDGVLRLGSSVMLHRDSRDYDVDTIFDDTEVSLRDNNLKNMIVSGADDRLLKSVLSSFMIWMSRRNDEGMKLHIFGYDKSISEKYGNRPNVYFHKSVQEQLDEMERQIEDTTGGYDINVFVEPDKYSEFTQSAGSIRSNPGVDSFKKVLDRTALESGITIVYCKSYKTLRSSMAYILGYAPIHLTAVGDMENLKYAMSDNVHLVSGEFDVPSRDAIKAYYYNKDTEKSGKVILYKPA